MLATASGVVLAIHFWAWNASVHLTTVAASVTLVSLQPIVVVAISAVFLKEIPGRRQITGIAIALAGATLIALPALSDPPHTAAPNAALGNALASAAAVAAAIYYSIGRYLRLRYGIWAYVGLCYTACFVTLVTFAVIAGVRVTPQPPGEVAIFAALAAGPMLLGHTGMNWALRHLPAFVVNLTVIAEPVGATLLAAIIPGIAQIPSALTLTGGVVVIAGLLLTLHGTVAASGNRKKTPSLQ